MKDCRECEYFNGYDYSDGLPMCDYEENGKCGYEYCPYNCESDVKKNGFKIEVDAGFMHDFIRHTLTNTIAQEACQIASLEIKKLVSEEIKDRVRAEMDRQIKAVVEAELAEFLSKEIKVGGGWSEPERTLTRTQYLSEQIEKELEARTNSEVLKKTAEHQAKSAIDKYEKKLRDDINASIKTYFNEATRQVLTENVVSMLMCNDTYKKLSDSMQTFLPERSGT